MLALCAKIFQSPPFSTFPAASPAPRQEPRTTKTSDFSHVLFSIFFSPPRKFLPTDENPVLIRPSQLSGALKINGLRIIKSGINNLTSLYYIYN
jgi:hypothetical protein